MERSNYSEDCEGWDLIRWRGAVKSAIRGKRGQAFLREMLETLDAMPEKRLVKDALVTPQGEVCAMGSVMVKRGIDASAIDCYDANRIADLVGVSPALVREIEFINDDAWTYSTPMTDERRWEIVRAWVANHVKEQEAKP